jgi:hypothetical protein
VVQIKAIRKDDLLQKKTIWWSVRAGSAVRLGDAADRVGTSRLPQLIAGPNRLFQFLDLYWRSPESSDFWYKSRQLKKTL